MAEGVNRGRGAPAIAPTYEQALDIAATDLVEQLTIQETPDHLVAVRLAEHACRRFRNEYDSSRHWQTGSNVGTLALLGQANALRALRGEQAGFSRYNVDLAIKEAYDNLDGDDPDILDARVRAITLHLGIAAIRHVRLDRHEHTLKQRAFTARRSHRSDMEAVEAAHGKAVEAIGQQRIESNRIRVWAHEARGYLKWQRKENQRDYWPQSKVRLSAAYAALEVASGDPHRAVALAKVIPGEARETWWKDISPDAYALFVQHWQAVASDIKLLARSYYYLPLTEAPVLSQWRNARLRAMLGSPDLDTIPEYPSADVV